MHEPDVLAAARPQSVAVTFFGRSWQLELSRAASWIGAIGYDLESLTGVFPGAIPEDDLDAMWELYSDPDASRRALNAARVSVQRGGGRDWWWTLNLVRKSLGIWPYINGKLLLSGVDAASISFPSWLDAAYMLLYSNMDEDGQMRLDLELSMRPKGVAVKMSKAATDKMLNSFAAD